MIKKMNSQDLNKIFEEAKNNSDKSVIDIQSIKEEITKKLMIINYVNEFTNMKIDNINAGIIANEKKVNCEVCYGNFEKFGYSVHAKFKNNPIDIFNLKLINSDGSIGKTMFKQNITCKVNDIANENYINLLIADSSDLKDIIFEEFKTNTVKIEYEIDNTLSTGTSRFNVIEIDPFISGAYNLQSIEFYHINESNNLSTTPFKTLGNFENIGKTRIILDEKIKFSKVTLTFKINFETQVDNIKIYPFGLKHIYFLEADFLADTSYAILPVYSDSLIEFVYNDIDLYTVNGKISTNCDMYNIEFYTDYTNNTLINRIYTSSDAAIYRIAKNTNKIYIKIPLVNENEANSEKEYLSLTGLEVNYQTNKEIII